MAISNRIDPIQAVRYYESNQETESAKRRAEMTQTNSSSVSCKVSFSDLYLNAIDKRKGE
ncbi:hypothetical protein HOU08_gp275 [Dickeya phage vB_DsoM_JA29]|uniref:Uncharacterized protein n=1 Tax=Dickeya phage vB_DsoM_JA29 TaxID=2283031 RepID=A0A384ZXN5_9CAUD|nr:hypothetical protein HOU08_gp275 [Dickeya phage vB_DsoM_JA29]AXG67001.1 hypothetical protein JA29_275 [Dickeya phage vB_DsoM_JA29]